jgi:hypothetical protein
MIKNVFVKEWSLVGRYDVAQICLNGHVVNDSSHSRPALNQTFCKKCGAKTINTCTNCNSPIRGYYHVEGVIDLTGRGMDAPSFCVECGNAYPWTEEKIKAAKELALEVEGLSDEEKNMLSNSIDDLITETPRTKLAVMRLKKFATKAGEASWEVFKEALKDIISESVRKLIWGQ